MGPWGSPTSCELPAVDKGYCTHTYWTAGSWHACTAAWQSPGAYQLLAWIFNRNFIKDAIFQTAVWKASSPAWGLWVSLCWPWVVWLTLVNHQSQIWKWHANFQTKLSFFKEISGPKTATKVNQPTHPSKSQHSDRLMRFGHIFITFYSSIIVVIILQNVMKMCLNLVAMLFVMSKSSHRRGGSPLLYHVVGQFLCLLVAYGTNKKEYRAISPFPLMYLGTQVGGETMSQGTFSSISFTISGYMTCYLNTTERR